MSISPYKPPASDLEAGRDNEKLIIVRLPFRILAFVIAILGSIAMVSITINDLIVDENLYSLLTLISIFLFTCFCLIISLTGDVPRFLYWLRKRKDPR